MKKVKQKRKRMPRAKVARLPQTVRAEIAARLRDGHSLRVLAEWLNKLPTVKDALRREFPGKRNLRISQDNLSTWRLSKPPELAGAIIGNNTASDSRDDLAAVEQNASKHDAKPQKRGKIVVSG